MNYLKNWFEKKPVIEAIYMYPVKALPGIRVDSVEIVPTGLKFDRTLMFATPESVEGYYKFLTQRETPQLALAKASLLEKDGVTYCEISYPLDYRNPESTTRKSFLVPLNDNLSEDAYPLVNAIIWNDTVRAHNLEEHMDPGMAEAMNLPKDLTILRAFDTRNVIRMIPDDMKAEPPRSVFVDYFPGNLLTLESLYDVAKNCIEKGGQDGLPPLPSTEPRDGYTDEYEQWVKRFRPNFVLSGARDVYDEESWKEIKIDIVDGEPQNWIVVCRNVRCPVPTVNPDLGVFHPKHQPYKAMQSFRRVDSGAPYQPCFSMNLVNTTNGYKIPTGSAVQILSRGEHIYEGI
ncbi:hypothetical protein CANCADRAFT_43194 [Tortispora caseinolytica NRRL Y-17796]|uniref:MOSC domain-containing protein n=1 Tax=Tortispora caseinolytica NRRL Y-17796 TaxID=767744 RepID=A0A1E4TLG7_9ASCO|nr:hypothetical protein CANCADRAFT_43194 [Tortispora caseinolytica NRRL Y-17796]